MDHFPHYKYFNDPRINAPEEVMLEIPEEEKASWIMFECRFETVDGFHRKGVSDYIVLNSEYIPC
jgi:hypothetical protein